MMLSFINNIANKLRIFKNKKIEIFLKIRLHLTISLLEFK